MWYILDACINVRMLSRFRGPVRPTTHLTGLWLINKYGYFCIVHCMEDTAAKRGDEVYSGGVGRCASRLSAFTMRFDLEGGFKAATVV